MNIFKSVDTDIKGSLVKYWLNLFFQVALPRTKNDTLSFCMFTLSLVEPPDVAAVHIRHNCCSI